MHFLKKACQAMLCHSMFYRFLTRVGRSITQFTFPLQILKIFTFYSDQFFYHLSANARRQSLRLLNVKFIEILHKYIQARMYICTHRHYNAYDNFFLNENSHFSFKWRWALHFSTIRLLFRLFVFVVVIFFNALDCVLNANSFFR